jgi:hypothetical protein
MTGTFLRRPLGPARRLGLSFALVAGLLIAIAPVAVAHAPSVVAPGNESPTTAHTLEDPTLSRAIGATLDAPGEVDWYRMELRAGDPLVVEMTAPDATGGIAASFDVLGPGLPAPATDAERELASLVGAEGLVRHAAEGGEREVHGGLGFIAWGGIRTTATADGTYWIAVRALEPGATGKYVLAPGVREEFGLDAIGGMADLVGFFDAPWPPEPGTTATGGADRLVAIVVGAVVVLVVLGIVIARLRGRQIRQHADRGAAA